MYVSRWLRYLIIKLSEGSDAEARIVAIICVTIEIVYATIKPTRVDDEL